MVWVNKCMWVVFNQTKNGFPAFDELIVTRFHALASEWARVFDPLPANAAPTRFVGRVVFLGCPGMDDAARAEVLAEVREILLRGIVGLLRILFGVEMVEVP